MIVKSTPHWGKVVDSVLGFGLVAAFIVTTTILVKEAYSGADGKQVVAQSIAFYVFCIFAITKWSIMRDPGIAGLRAWSRGWAIWALLPALQVIGTTNQQLVSLWTLKCSANVLSTVNSAFFLYAALELGWPARHYWSSRVATAAGAIGGGAVLIMMRIPAIVAWTDALLSLSVAIVVGVALRKRLLEGEAAWIDPKRRRIEGLLLLAFLIAFGCLQVGVAVVDETALAGDAVLVARSISPALLGIALYFVLTRAGIRNLEDQLESAEFLIDSEFRIVAASRLARAVTGLDAGAIRERSAAEVVFRYTTDIEEIMRCLRSGAPFGPRLVVCKRAVEGGDLEEVRRVVMAKRMGPADPYASITVGVAEFATQI